MARDAGGHGSNGKLTAEISERICLAVRQGATIEGAFAYAGVAKATFYDWVKRGRQPNARNPYKAFVAELDEALAAFEVGAMALIAKHGQEEWQANAWRLERRFPDKYGRRTRLDGTVQVAAVPMIDPSRGTVDELEQLRYLLAKFSPQPEEVRDGQRPALELLPGEAVDL